MKVSVKDLAVSMDLGNKGIELDVYDNGDPPKHLGDLRIGKATIEWCKGLGFSFDPTNVRRLGAPGVFLNEHNKPKPCYATAVGLEFNEAMTAYQRVFNQAAPGPLPYPKHFEDMKCLKRLRTSDLLDGL